MTMSRDTLKLGIALLAMTMAVVAWMGDRPIPHLPGVLAPDDPMQGDSGSEATWQARGYEIHPRAAFSLRARVLSATHYRWDAGARLAPVDLALGWGGMSDSTMLERFKVTQGSRYFTLYPRDGDVDLADAMRHSSNMHLIPATEAVRRKLESAKEGNLVTLRGQLVDVGGPGGFTWHSSLRRDDSGAGACELVWVEEFDLR
jgi:hypothetical protein